MAKYTSMDYEHYEDEAWEEKIQRKIKPKTKKKSYDELKKNGIKFAPINLAAKFSVEHPKTNEKFGINDKTVFR